MPAATVSPRRTRQKVYYAIASVKETEDVLFPVYTSEFYCRRNSVLTEMSNCRELLAEEYAKFCDNINFTCPTAEDKASLAALQEIDRILQHLRNADVFDELPIYVEIRSNFIYADFKDFQGN